VRYKDPAELACPACGHEAEHRVRDLLALCAACPACHASLAQTGQEMRDQLAAWQTYMGKLQIALELERGRAFELNEPELDRVLVGLDFVALVRRKTNDAAPDADLAERVRQAVEKVRRRPTSLADLGLPCKVILAEEVGVGHEPGPD
jgi:hypothetical protein